MKYFVSEIIPRLQRYSRKLDEKTLLVNHQWVVFDDTTTVKSTYIFRDNGTLIISEKGVGAKAKWEDLGNQTLLIEKNEEVLLFSTSFLDETSLVLNLHDTDSYAFLLNETKIGLKFNSIKEINDFLASKYNSESEINGTQSLNGFTYTESSPVEKFDFVWGTYLFIYIFFSDGKKGTIYKGKSSGKYFYLRGINDLVYCRSKQDCIQQLHAYVELREKGFYGT